MRRDQRMNLLITGGAGFIGSNFVYHWLREHPGDRLIVIDALTYAGNVANLQGAIAGEAIRFVHGDICDTALLETLFRGEHIDTVVHFAAESHVDRSISGPDAFIVANIEGTHSLLKVARRMWLENKSVTQHRFHHVSTDEVYGSLGPEDAAFNEATRYAPNSPYSATKAASDHLVRAYHHTYGLSVTTSNCSNNYGPFQFPEKLIPLMIVNLLEGRPLPVYGDGRNVRDWLHVRDHCAGVESVLLRGRPGEVYNIGGRSECENIALVKELCGIVDDVFAKDETLRARFRKSPAASGSKSDNLIEFVKDRPGHDRRYSIDCSKAERELGFAATIGISAGLQETLHWYLANEPWWRSIMDGSYRGAT
jgi:dTDP-glucose 4,6-dehydratase